MNNYAPGSCPADYEKFCGESKPYQSDYTLAIESYNSAVRRLAANPTNLILQQAVAKAFAAVEAS